MKQEIDASIPKVFNGYKIDLLKEDGLQQLYDSTGDEDINSPDKIVKNHLIAFGKKKGYDCISIFYFIPGDPRLNSTNFYCSNSSLEVSMVVKAVDVTSGTYLYNKIIKSGKADAKLWYRGVQNVLAFLKRTFLILVIKFVMGGESMNRKQFIYYAGAGIVVGGLSLINPLGMWGNEIKAIEEYTTEYVEGFNQDEVKILNFATRAPSGHNTQPWTIYRIQPYNWVIGTNQSRWLPAVDPENREMLLSIGAFLESIVLAAGALGYEALVEIIARGRRDHKIAEVKLIQSKETKFSLDKITSRRTIRNSYLSRELTSEDVKQLVDYGKNNILYIPLRSATGKFLAEGTIEANKQQVFREAAQVELAEWIRWSNDDAKRKMDGLTPDTMEISGIASWYVRRFYNRQSVLEHNFRNETVKKIVDQVRNCGGWLIITSPTSKIEDIIASGRLLQRMWLNAKAKMIAIHPMTQMLEEYPFEESVVEELDIRDEIQFILRTGYVSRYPAPVSRRMPVARIISH